ncbi:phage tail domain-containing protein [Streptococcus danieliae]|uniref:Phage tail family protein n=1 Tax=Streptococcus danieliae TaxID=747656 RepID=A0A7Z0S597_9STRE|nr:phage tail domain-containing protein [Streptococcus danieliae]MBF0699681.1 phage tail family protein [Streptococcus danieliae]NYS96857.1 phage tail family protein [Streptococcus danieliae]
MDLEINQRGRVSTLSQFGIYNIEIQESSPELDMETRTVKGRSGRIFDNANFKKKEIEVRGRIKVPSISSFYEKQDFLNGFFLSRTPYFIRKLVPEQDELYRFELPGSSSGDFAEKHREYLPWKYRHEVLVTKEINFSFKGRFTGGLVYDLHIHFETANLPFGQSDPRDVVLSGGKIPYHGTEILSQLEVPFRVEFVSSGGQNAFYFRLNNHNFMFNQASDLEDGAKITVFGHEVVMNGENANEKGNYEFFELYPFDENVYQTDFKGRIRILGLVDLFK